MNTNNDNIDVQFGTTSNANPITVWSSQTLSDALRFILHHNKKQNNNQILTENDGRIFDILEQFPECSKKMFMNIIKYFRELYDIDLYIINYDGIKFDVLNKDNYLEENSTRNMSFLSFNEDNTICGALCIIINNENIDTVFSCEDFHIWDQVDDYLDEVNNNKSKSVNTCIEIEQQHHNQLNSGDSIQADDRAESRALIEQMLKPISRLFDKLSLQPDTINSLIHSPAFNMENLEHLSHQDIILALKNQFNGLSNMLENIQQSISILQNDEMHVHRPVFPDDTNIVSTQADTSVEMDCALQTVSLSTNTSVLPLLPQLSNSIEITIESIPSEPIPSIIYLNRPIIVTQPKPEWHSRTVQELKDGKNPFLSGEGSQRTPIRVEVPTESETPIYIGIALLTYDGQDHPSKVAVPKNTKVKPDYPLKNNDLDCLEFNEVSIGTMFDPVTRYNYSKISSDEHTAQLKEVRLHVFKLYQYGIITKKLIKDKQLNLFKFAFWFCSCQNGEFKRVSPIAATRTIREKYIVDRK